MPPATLILHIGLPKTGTTYLQNAVLPELPGIRYMDRLAKNRFRFHKWPADLIGQCFRCAPAVWDALGAEIFANDIGRVRSKDPNPVVISDELIGMTCEVAEKMEAHLHGFSAAAAAAGYGTVKLICATRRQDQWLGSWFAQTSGGRSPVTQATFEQWVRDMLDPWRRRYAMGMLLDYAYVAGPLIRAVGRENVLFVPYELFAARPVRFFRIFFGFMLHEHALDLDVLAEAWGGRAAASRDNKRSLGDYRWAVRAISEQGRRIPLKPYRVLSALGLPTEIHIPKRERSRARQVKMTPALAAEVMDRFRSSNQAFAAMADIDLEPYGYY